MRVALEAQSLLPFWDFWGCIWELMELTILVHRYILIQPLYKILDCLIQKYFNRKENIQMKIRFLLPFFLFKHKWYKLWKSLLIQVDGNNCWARSLGSSMDRGERAGASEDLGLKSGATTGIGARWSCPGHYNFLEIMMVIPDLQG